MKKAIFAERRKNKVNLTNPRRCYLEASLGVDYIRFATRSAVITRPIKVRIGL